jgi:hypothetical protein
LWGFGFILRRFAIVRVKVPSLMPQPLSKVRPGAPFNMCFAGDRPTNHNPRLGLLAVEGIISWTNVENFLLNAYTTLLGGQYETASIAYLALETQSAKTAVIQAVARKKLEVDKLEILNAILKRVKTV